MSSDWTYDSSSKYIKTQRHGRRNDHKVIPYYGKFSRQWSVHAFLSIHRTRSGRLRALREVAWTIDDDLWTCQQRLCQVVIIRSMITLSLVLASSQAAISASSQCCPVRSSSNAPCCASTWPGNLSTRQSCLLLSCAAIFRTQHWFSYLPLLPSISRRYSHFPRREMYEH